jgi:surface carbohydrate biosynthesis protein
MGFRNSKNTSRKIYLKFSTFKKNSTLILQFIFKTKKVIKKPKISEILIYDSTFPELLLKYIKVYNYSILQVRRESVNLYILCKAALTKDFWTDNKWRIYTYTYINMVSPKVLITFIDNTQEFYLISQRFKEITTIFIQNGTRSPSGDIFESITQNDKYCVDYMLVHNREIGNKYKEFIKGEVISIGSFINNDLIHQLSSVSNRVVFISQFRPMINKNGIFYIEKDNTIVFWEDFFNAEKICLNFLKIWCQTNNKNLVIAGVESGYESPEQLFFSEILQDFPFEYVPRTSTYSNYELISSAEIVVTIDSTLGFESIGLGKKTAVFSIRPKFRFGWPASLPDKGYFWTNKENVNHFCEIMDFLNTASDHYWSETIAEFKLTLMDFNPGNTKLIQLLNRLLKNSDF